MKRTLLAFAALLPLAAMAQTIFPLKVSENRHYLADPNGAPFFSHGDTAWSLLVALNQEEGFWNELSAYHRNDVKPTFLIEARYECLSGTRQNDCELVLEPPSSQPAVTRTPSPLEFERQTVELCRQRTRPAAEAGRNGTAPTAFPELPGLRISANKRFLVTADGRPFFWLADTAWRLSNLAPDEVDACMANRVRHAFNVIQVHPGFEHPDFAGNRPFLGDDPGRPNEAFWRHIDGPRAGAGAVRRKAYWSVYSGACGHTYGHNDVYGFFTPAFPG